MDNKDRKHEISKGLRKLLETLYETTELFTFEELLEQYAETVGKDHHVLFYMKERKRFVDPGDEKKSDYLIFQYLSFELKGGKTKRFVNDVESLEEISAQLIDNNYELEESDLSCFYWDSKNPQADKIQANLSKRIFTAFYKNCGSHEHFLENVSTRHIREFYLENDHTDKRNLTTYIEERMGLKTAICSQSDELLSTSPENVTDVINIDVSSDFDFESLFQNKKFQNDLFTATRRKLQTFGHLEQKGLFYVIKAFKDEYFNEVLGEGRTAYKTQQKAVAIYVSADSRIRLDNVNSANSLILNVMNTLEESSREEALWKVTKNSYQLEEELASYPQKTQRGLLAKIEPIFEPLFEHILKTTDAEGVCVSLHDPFNNELVVEFSATKDNAQLDFTNIALDNQPEHISTKVFLGGKAASVDNIKKIKSSYDWAVKSYDSNRLDKEIFDEYKDRYDERSKLKSSFEPNGALYCLPIHVGRLIRGTIELYASNVTRLTVDAPFFRRSAQSIGETFRRASLANDQGWLKQMSFIHATRHRMEAIIRDAKLVDPTIGDRLNDLFSMQKSSKIQKPHNIIETNFDVLSQFRKTPFSKFGPNSIEHINSEIRKYLDQCDNSDSQAQTVVEILDTLVSNHNHSPVTEDNLHVVFRENVQRKSALEISFKPKGQTGSIKRLQHLCVSPIRDKSTPTYHYGIFLLSTQVRMSGGFSLARPLVDFDGLGNAEFGFSILLPT